MIYEIAFYSACKRYILRPQKSMVLPLDQKAIGYWEEKFSVVPIKVADQVKHLGVGRKYASSSKVIINNHIQGEQRAACALTGTGLHGINGLNPRG